MSTKKTPPGFRVISRPNGGPIHIISYVLIGDDMSMVIPHGMSVNPQCVGFYWAELATYTELLKRLDDAKLERPPAFALSAAAVPDKPAGFGELPADCDAHDLAWLSCFIAETHNPLRFGLMLPPSYLPLLKDLPGKGQARRISFRIAPEPNAPGTSTPH